MNFAVDQRDQTTILALRGDFTVDTLEQVRQTITDRLDEDGRDFVFDLAGVEFIDSSALEVLLWTQEQVEDRLGQVRLAGVRDNVEAILRLTRLASRFEQDPDVETAVTNLGL